MLLIETRPVKVLFPINIFNIISFFVFFLSVQVLSHVVCCSFQVTSESDVLFSQRTAKVT